MIRSGELRRFYLRRMALTSVYVMQSMRLDKR